MQHRRREYNIVILGAGGVGKSCLTAQFVHNEWIESYDPTIEDSYRKVIDVDGRSCVLEILDTAGTEQFTAMREIYMKTGQGFLLVYSITSLNTLTELSDLRDQILRIKEAESVPIVIVGNKSDLEEDRAVNSQRAINLSQKWGRVPFYETSARKRQNVDEVFLDLCRQMMRADANSGWAADGYGKEKPSGGKKSPKTSGGRQSRSRFCVIL